MSLSTEEAPVHEDASVPERAGPQSKTPQELAGIVTRLAATEEWMQRVRLRRDGRWYERVYLDKDHDIWIISWLPGQSTGFHDHGESSGAFVVATGTLEEHRPGEQPVVIGPDQPRAFGSNYAHDVRNGSTAPAISIHAYSPPLDEMNRYDLDGGEPIARERASDWAGPMDIGDEGDRLELDRLDLERDLNGQGDAVRADRLSVEQLLAAARERLERLTPLEASQAASDHGAVLVDIRPQGQRAMEGAIPGALIVERNVLEWRFDPASPARLPIATDHNVQVVVFCSEGYASSLAAAALQDLGLWRATDMVGGFQAWRAASLPIE